MSELSHEIKPEGVEEASKTWYPSVYLEISKEQADLMELEADITLTLTGKVKGLRSDSEGGSGGRYEVILDLREVAVDSDDNTFADLSKDD